MQTKRSDELNELTRQVAERCAVCRYGRPRMRCPKKVCHNKQVRENLKKIDQIQKEATTNEL